MKTLSKMVSFHKGKDLCMLNRDSGDDALNPVLRVSVCRTFWTHNLLFSNPDPRLPSFQTRLTPLNAFHIISHVVVNTNVNCYRCSVS